MNLEERKKKFLNLFKNKWTALLVFALIIGIAIRLYYFFKLGSIPIWWDEASYLTRAKHFGGITQYIEPMVTWSPRRPFLMAALWGGMYRLGIGGEMAFRFTEVLFSIAALWLIYLLGKEMFNKKVGIIACFLLSTFYLHIFFTFRLLVGLPSTTLYLASVYFFWKGYINKKGKKNLWWFGIFAGLTVFVRASTVLGLIPLALIILFKEKHKVVLNKKIWGVFLLFLLVLSPFILWVTINYEGNPVKKITGIGEGRFTADSKGWNGVMDYIKFYPTYLQTTLFIVFLASCYLFINLFLGFDLLFKDPGKVAKEFWILSMIVIYTLFFGLTGGYMEPRYLLPAFPAIFLLMGNFLDKIGIFLDKYKKHLGFIVVLGILLFGAYGQVIYSDSLLDHKSNDGFSKLKEAAEWINKNSDKEDFVFANTDMQPLSYYLDRSVSGLGQNETHFEELIEEYNPKYIIITFLLGNLPEYRYVYPSQHPETWKPVQAYMQGENPVVIIYEKIGYNKENISS